MDIYISSGLTAILYLIGLTGLVLKSPRIKHLIILGGYFFLVANFIAPNIGHFIALFYILGSIVYIIINCRPLLTNIVFSLYGYILLVLVSYLCMIPLNLLGITIEAVAVNYAVPFLFFEIITISFVILVLRKLLFNLGNFDIHEDSVNIQRSFLIQIIFGICTIFLNIIYSSSLGYPTQVQTLNGIFISFYVLSTIALFYSSFKILRRNYELTIKQNDEKYVDDYLRRMEGFYEEIRSFRHDYLNIFCTMHCHIENLSKQLPDNENMDALKDYFDKINKSGTEQINHDYFTLGQLSNIKILEIKSIFYSKLLFAMNQELHVTLEITEPLENISMDIIKLCRIIGILLDNSIEAAILAAESILHIAIINKKEDTVFEIENSMLPITIPVSELAEKGVTTKENHDGLGLHNVQKITDELSNVFFSFGYNELFFRQQLRIRKGSA